MYRAPPLFLYEREKKKINGYEPITRIMWTHSMITRGGSHFAGLSVSFWVKAMATMIQINNRLFLFSLFFEICFSFSSSNSIAEVFPKSI